MGLYHHLCCVRCCYHLPEICCLLPGPAQGWQFRRWTPRLEGEGCPCPAQVEGCNAPGSLRCWHSLRSHGGAYPHPLQAAWPRCIVSWPAAGRGALYQLPGVDARLCGVLRSCSSRSGHCGGQTTPTTGCRLPDGQKHQAEDPSRIRQWLNSHTCAHRSVAPRSPPNHSWKEKKQKHREKSCY